jgi:hypothetical protein
VVRRGSRGNHSNPVVEEGSFLVWRQARFQRQRQKEVLPAFSAFDPHPSLDLDRTGWPSLVRRRPNRPAESGGRGDKLSSTRKRPLRPYLANLHAFWQVPQKPRIPPFLCVLPRPNGKGNSWCSKKPPPEAPLNTHMSGERLLLPAIPNATDHLERQLNILPRTHFDAACQYPFILQNWYVGLDSTTSQGMRR